MYQYIICRWIIFILYLYIYNIDISIWYFFFVVRPGFQERLQIVIKIIMFIPCLTGGNKAAFSFLFYFFFFFFTPDHSEPKIHYITFWVWVKDGLHLCKQHLCRGFPSLHKNSIWLPVEEIINRSVFTGLSIICAYVFPVTIIKEHVVPLPKENRYDMWKKNK